MRVIVVGAGVLGLSISFEMLRRGYLVSCIAPDDSSDPAVSKSASAAAGAMLGGFSEITAEPPHRYFDIETKLRVESARHYPEWIEKVNGYSMEKVLLHRGTLILGNTACATDSKNIQEIRAVANIYDEPFEILRLQDIDYIHPHSMHMPTELLFLPGEAWIDSERLLRALFSAVSSFDNFEFIKDEVIDVQQEKSVVITNENTVISYDHVVLACGDAASKLLRDLQCNVIRKPRIVKGKGSYSLFEPQVTIPHVVRTPNRDFACGLHMVPRDDGSVYLGATNRVELDEDFGNDPSLAELSSLLHNCSHQFDTRMRNWQFIRAGSGGRPFSLDGVMLFGKIDDSSVSVATGTYRNGIVLAPKIAEMIADEIETGCAHNLPFSPNAHLDKASLKEVDTVARRAFHDLVGYLLEPNGHLPYDREEQLADALTSFYFALRYGGEERRLFEELATQFEETLAPDLIPYLFEVFAQKAKK